MNTIDQKAENAEGHTDGEIVLIRFYSQRTVAANDGNVNDNVIDNINNNNNNNRRNGDEIVEPGIELMNQAKPIIAILPNQPQEEAKIYAEHANNNANNNNNINNVNMNGNNNENMNHIIVPMVNNLIIPGGPQIPKNNNHNNNHNISCCCVSCAIHLNCNLPVISLNMNKSTCMHIICWLMFYLSPILYLGSVLMVSDELIHTDSNQTSSKYYSTTMGALYPLITLWLCILLWNKKIKQELLIKRYIFLSLYMILVFTLCGHYLGLSYEGYSFYYNIPAKNDAAYKDLLKPSVTAFFTKPYIGYYNMQYAGYTVDTAGVDENGNAKPDEYYYVVPFVSYNNNENINSSFSIWVVNHGKYAFNPGALELFNYGNYEGALQLAYEDFQYYESAIGRVEVTNNLVSNPNKVLYRNKNAKDKLVSYQNKFFDCIIASTIMIVLFWIVSYGAWKSEKTCFS